jgi:hypothetical protein
MEMADFIVARCQSCGKSNKYCLAPSSQDKLFESVANTNLHDQEEPPSLGFWASYWGSESGVYLSSSILAGVGTYALCYAYSVDVNWSVVSGLAVGVGLPLLKVILYAPPKKAQESGKRTIEIKLSEPLPSGTRTYFDEFSPKITETDLQKMAKATYPDRHNPTIMRISQTSLVSQRMSNYRARFILSELSRLNYSYTTKDNKTCFTLRGKSTVNALKPKI